MTSTTLGDRARGTRRVTIAPTETAAPEAERAAFSVVSLLASALLVAAGTALGIWSAYNVR